MEKIRTLSQSLMSHKGILLCFFFVVFFGFVVIWIFFGKLNIIQEDIRLRFFLYLRYFILNLSLCLKSLWRLCVRYCHFCAHYYHLITTVVALVYTWVEMRGALECLHHRLVSQLVIRRSSF